MRVRRCRSLFSAIITAVLLAGLFGWAPASAAPEGKVNWSACFQDFGPFQCASVGVPLDYDDPNGAQISIAMVRLPATNPALRQGSLFINPGGPGGSGVDFAVFAAPFLFTQDVRDRFDIVGFDPRGIFRSRMLRCFGTPKQWAPYFTPFAFPITQAEVDAWIAADRYLDDACDQRGGGILDHMSTANVARDMDRLREAVGDSKLTYYGLSYGSMLGQTYANMFPNNFRALVIDGVLDPIAWTTGAPSQQGLPFSTRLRSDVGAQETLEEFFRLCDAGGNACPLASAAGAKARYAALAETLLTGPIIIQDPVTGGLFEYKYSFLITDHAVQLVPLAGLRLLLGFPRVAGQPGRAGPGDGSLPCSGATVTHRHRLYHAARIPALSELHRGLPGGSLLRLRQSGVL
jgi:pimeloyl-ACP methyl ester carboxylesterase